MLDSWVALTAPAALAQALLAPLLLNETTRRLQKRSGAG